MVRRRLALLPGLLASASLIGGCGHPVQNKLEGRWLGGGVENFDDAVVAAATGWARGTSFEFSGGSVTVSIPAEEPRTGKYKIASVHESDVQLTVERADGAVDNVHLKLDDDRSMRWMLGDNRSVVLSREQ